MVRVAFASEKFLIRCAAHSAWISRPGMRQHPRRRQARGPSSEDRCFDRPRAGGHVLGLHRPSVVHVSARPLGALTLPNVDRPEYLTEAQRTALEAELAELEGPRRAR